MCYHVCQQDYNEQQAMPKFKISASILSADFARLGEEVKTVLSAGADEIHFDVMDNHYVPNLTVGPLVCTALRQYGINAPIDVHLMTQPVDNLITAFAKAGANSITFHPEASLHIDRSLQLIRDHGCQAGLAFNPATPLNYLEHVWDKLDLILVMAVNPGFGGQEFISSALDKIQTIKKLITTHKNTLNLAVDGGIKINNIAAIAKAGADTFAIGSTIFAKNNSPEETIAQLRKILAQI